jgi:hypothetical protein
MRDAVMTLTRPSSGTTGSHDSSEANLDRETQSRLARGQLLAGDIVMTRPRPTLGGGHNHDSPEANLGQETQSQLARG